MKLTILTYTQWEITCPHCLDRESDPGRTDPNPRMFAEAVLWVARTGRPSTD